LRYFLDTEFIEQPCTIDLISIGIVREDGKTFYAVNQDCKFRKASDWVKTNVLPQLPPKPRDPAEMSPTAYSASKAWMKHRNIKEAVLKFIGDDLPEFWGYYADYDWVVFCWLFGSMMDLPKGFPMWCNDIKQFQTELGVEELPVQVESEHDALQDALWNKQAWDFLNGISEDRQYANYLR
jgi:hypothetical protein